MTCSAMPWEVVAQGLIFVGVLGGFGVLIIMYLDGYWEPERVYRRWLNGDSFTAIDERHRLRQEKNKNILKRR